MRSRWAESLWATTLPPLWARCWASPGTAGTATITLVLPSLSPATNFSNQVADALTTNAQAAEAQDLQPAGHLFIPVYFGGASTASDLYYAPEDEEKATSAWRDAYASILKQGYLVDRPKGELARMVFAQAKPSYLDMIKRVKHILDPEGRLNPGQFLGDINETEDDRPARSAARFPQRLLLCGKCKLCQANHVQEVTHGRFWRNCPSGTRFRFEAYYASGRLEMARALDLQEIKPTEAMAHALYTCMECGSCQEQCYPVKQIFPLRVIDCRASRRCATGGARWKSTSRPSTTWRRPTTSLQTPGGTG